MDLKNANVHMANQSVKLDGKVYKIDQNCIIKGVELGEAKKFLAMREWSAVVERAPVVPPPASSVPVPEPEPEPKIPAPEPVEDDGDEEYPDPSMLMTKDELQAMAKDYEIDYMGLNKQQMVDAITKKMYPDG